MSIVITSYSIHYTKLYEQSLVKVTEMVPFFSPVMPMTPVTSPRATVSFLTYVITSYSIHYTKLYEVVSRGMAAAAYGRVRLRGRARGIACKPQRRSFAS